MKRITISPINALIAITMLLGCGCCAMLVPKFYDLISDAVAGSAAGADQIIFSFSN